MHEYLGHFHFLAIMNNAAIHISTQLSERLLSIPLDIYLGMELLDHMVILCLAFFFFLIDLY